MTETENEHWENIYSTKSEQQVSWFQEYPNTSMEFCKHIQPAIKCKHH